MTLKKEQQERQRLQGNRQVEKVDPGQRLHGTFKQPQGYLCVCGGGDDMSACKTRSDLCTLSLGKSCNG